MNGNGNKVVESAPELEAAPSFVVEEEDLACGICFDDKPALYGLLSTSRPLFDQ